MLAAFKSMDSDSDELVPIQSLVFLTCGAGDRTSWGIFILKRAPDAPERCIFAFRKDSAYTCDSVSYHRRKVDFGGAFASQPMGPHGAQKTVKSLMKRVEFRA